MKYEMTTIGTLVTRLVKAASGKESLRTTVPMSIVKTWNLREGDEIDWSWEIVNGKQVLRVKRV